ncbi:NADPH oxidase 4 isoform X4 [Takifugu flavidus]|uniref:NADPH oxidase 4 isoform X4 n=1 Tax=Takifugu flavidus TaxID=433684 RepID=UPI0025448125|nr:NADPH oxidase 4 isoform X4 [Takifugu flavidus]
MSVRSWIANEGGKFLVLMLWLGVNTWMFLNTFLLFSSGEQYYYLYKMLGLGLCISRASASVLNLNCSLVLLPMCRSLLKFIRGTHTVSSRKTRRMLDKYKTFHVACGLAICIFSAIHVSAHLANAANFSTSYSEEFPSLNVARYRGEDPKWIILTTIPGVTGIVLVLILFLMLMSSSNCVRSFNYEIFWYTHNLFIVFYIVLMVHMVGGVLKYQTNIEAHPPGCLTANQSNMDPQAKEMEKADNEERRCTEEAHFQGHYPQTWIWLSGPLCLYCAERFFRYIRSCDPVTIVTVIRHPCNVIELQMLKNKFAARPGQYILLNCPAVSSFENHPFTLTTCPTENKKTFSIHLRIVGDWTERFTQLLLTGSRTDMKTLPMVQHRKYPKIYVDGPFGSPSEDVFNYDVSLCVAGGIGVTPFACMLHTLLDRGWTHFRLQRLYFVWVCSELQSFYWFAELLCSVHHKNMSAKYRPLTSRLLVGRPRWKLLLNELGKTNKHKRIGVFCCGPKAISRTLHRCGSKWSSFLLLVQASSLCLCFSVLGSGGIRAPSVVSDVVARFHSGCSIHQVKHSFRQRHNAHNQKQLISLISYLKFISMLSGATLTCRN